MHKVLVTGASGFIGKEVVRQLVAAGRPVRVALRDGCARDDFNSSVEVVETGHIDGKTLWHKALAGIDQIIHLASHVHQPGTGPEIFACVNVQGTEHLARMALAADVTRLVYVSSVKAQGETTYGSPMWESDPLAPEDAYGCSKRDAELALKKVACDTTLEFSIIRPTLVYGPNAVGNLQRLMALVARGLPLPFGALQNRRSLVDVETLADLCIRCLDHPAARNEIFLAADDAPISTTKLLKCLAAGLDITPLLFPFSGSALRFAGRLLRRRDAMTRLLGSLEVDATKARTYLDWPSRASSEAGLVKMAREFRARGGHAR